MTAHVRHQAVFSRIFNRHRFENNELEWLFRRYILRVSMTTSYMSFSSLSAFVLLKPFSSCITLICFVAHYLILKYTKLLVIITPIHEKFCFTHSMISHGHFNQVQHASIRQAVALFVILTASLATAPIPNPNPKP